MESIISFLTTFISANWEWIVTIIGIPSGYGILEVIMKRLKLEGKLADIFEKFFEKWDAFDLNVLEPATLKFAEGFGKLLTNFWQKKSPALNKLWQVIVEPFIILVFGFLFKLIAAVFTSFSRIVSKLTSAFAKGLRSDNLGD